MSEAMHDKVCLVTGATSGIGRATALGLARLGATVAVVGRDPEKTEATCQQIAEASGNDRVEPFLADLSSQLQVRFLADNVLERFNRLDLLVNNAGAVFDHRVETEDGLESTFALNHLAYFLLTNLLLDRLEATAPSRIVNIASEAQAFGRMWWDDLQLESGYEITKAYGQSKLANVMWTYELARRLAGSGVTVNALHPGVVATNFGRGAEGLFGLLARMTGPFSMRPEVAAKAVIELATAPSLAGQSGGYYAKGKLVKTSKDAQDPALCRRLWDVSAQLTAPGRRRGAGFPSPYRPA